MNKFTTIFLLLFAGIANAQIPVISSVNVNQYFPGGSITISGTGFSADPNQLTVWFGAAEGRIVYSTTSIIEVIVPPGTHADYIRVINKFSKKSGRSPRKFYSNFNGVQPFDASKIGSSITFQDNQQFFELCSCDFNKDGKVDIAVTKFNSTSGSVQIFTNNSTVGNLSFANTTSFNHQNQTADIQCGDLNNDGWPDLVATKGGPDGVDRNQLYVFPNINGTISGAAALTIPVGTVTTQKVQIVDMNADGLPELVVSNAKEPRIFVFRNTSVNAISFNSTAIGIDIPNALTTFGIEVQDIDGDRRPDIFLTAVRDNQAYVKVFKNESTIDNISFVQVFEKLVGIVQDLAIGDVNNDGRVDILVSSAFSTDAVSVYLNNSTASTISFTDATKFTANDAWGLDLGDINGDGFLDVAVGNPGQKSLTLLINDKTGKFNPVSIPGNNEPRYTQINDYDGDGIPDLAYTSEATDTGPYLLEIRRNANCHQPVILSEATRYICPGQTIDFQAIPAPGTTFTWFLGATQIKTGPEPFASITGTGALTVRATNGSCSFTSAPIALINGTGSVPGDPVVTNDGPKCVGGTINLKATTITGATYQWSGPNGFTSTQQNPILTNVQPEMAGEYSLIVKVGDCQTSEFTTIVEVFTFPVVFIQSSTGDGFCEGTNSTLSVPATNGITYKWFRNDVEIGGATSNSVVINSAGTYHVVLTSGLGCSYEVPSIAVVTTLPPQIDPQVSNASACLGEQLQFSANLTNNTAFTVDYLWTFGDGTVSTTMDPTKTYTTAGSKSVTLKASWKEVTNCSSTKPVNISVAAAIPPVIQPSKDPACPGEEVTLTVQGTYSNYLWDNGETGSSRIVTETGVQYSVETTDGTGCKGNDNITLQSLTPAVINVEFVPATTNADPFVTTILPGNEVTINLTGSSSYLWGANEGITDNTLATQTLSPTQTTQYPVTGISADGCEIPAVITINVDGSAGVPLVIAPSKIFTPNGDTMNDLWVIESIENYQDEGVQVTVFDRRGVIVFESMGYQEAWNGTNGERELPEDTYFFIIQVPGSNYIPVKGTVLLIRG